MAVSSKDLSAEAVDRFLEQLKNKPKFRALVDSLSAQAQAIEDTLLAILVLTNMNGLVRSVVDVILTGTDGTVVPEGSEASVDTDPDAVFATVEDATLVLAPEHVPFDPYVEGDIVMRDGGINAVYLCVVGGTSGSDGPELQDPDVLETEGTVTWRFMGSGTAYAAVEMQSEDASAEAPAGHLITLETAIGGWTGLNNDQDARPNTTTNPFVTGTHLDTIGKIVGEERHGRDDDAYRTAILARIKLNSSSGTPEEIVAIVRAMVGDVQVKIREYFPASFVAEIVSDFTSAIVTPESVGTFVRSAAPAGVGAGTLIHPAGAFRYDSGPGFDVGKYAKIF